MHYNVLAYDGCYPESSLPSGTSATYDSPNHMTTGFCAQVCLAENGISDPQFIALSVSARFSTFNVNRLKVLYGCIICDISFSLSYQFS